MRLKPTEKVEAGRVRGPRGTIWGIFKVNGPCGRELRIISDDGCDDQIERELQGWEHVSVSIEGRVPNWEEMSWIKEQFWNDDETVLQFHPKKTEYVNIHPHVLHLWRNVGLDHPLPPKGLV